MAKGERRISRRANALIWCIAVAIVIGVLIYLEQIAMLYVLATLALVALLIVVGFSDLRNVDRESVKGFAGHKD